MQKWILIVGAMTLGCVLAEAKEDPWETFRLTDCIPLVPIVVQDLGENEYEAYGDGAFDAKPATRREYVAPGTRYILVAHITKITKPGRYVEAMAGKLKGKRTVTLDNGFTKEYLVIEETAECRKHFAILMEKVKPSFLKK